MTFHPMMRLTSAVAVAALLGLGNAATAASFPPITAEQQALTQVASEPNAPAVVLFHQGELQMDVRGKLSDSLLTVRKRIKILTEEGKEYGEIRLLHSSFARLARLVGRTVLVDGTVLELAQDAVFKRKTSRRNDDFTTVAAFPGVAVGAILDVEYELRYDGSTVTYPWQFQEKIPTLRSEVSFVVPEHIGFREWTKAFPDRFHREIKKQPRGRIVHAWMEDMPSLPDEPFSYPDVVFANQYLIIPTEYGFGNSLSKLNDSWPRVCDQYERSSHAFRTNDAQTRSRARELAAAAGGSQRDQAAAVYRFVRDQLASDDIFGVYFAEGATVDSVLADGHGSWTEKALLLQAMLDALKIGTEMLWVAAPEISVIDATSPYSGWFDGMIVRARIDGQEVLLDSFDPGLGFGQLPPGLEGAQALHCNPRQPEFITLPTTPFDQSARRAEVALALDDAGRLTGNGTLHLTGHHAWQEIDGERSVEERTKAWQERLEGWFDDFTVSDVTVAEAADERRVDVAWQMAQPEEEVLGDESTISPSRPLGPVEQPFKTATRQTPARFDFLDRDEVALTVTWPESWQVSAAPREWDFLNDAGAVTASVEVDEAARRLRYTRRFDTTKQQFVNSTELATIRQLYSQAVTNDGQSLLLVRR